MGLLLHITFFKINELDLNVQIPIDEGELHNGHE